MRITIFGHNRFAAKTSKSGNNTVTLEKRNLLIFVFRPMKPDEYLLIVN